MRTESRLWPVALFAALSLQAYLVGQLVLPQPSVNCVPQEVVGRPGQKGDLEDKLRLDPVEAREDSGEPNRVLRGGRTLRGDVVLAKGSSPARLVAVRSYGAFCGSPLWRFISFKAPLSAGTSVLPVPKYAFAGPGGVLPLLTSLLAPLGLPLPPLDMPVAPPPAAYAKLGIKINATVAKDLSFIAFSKFWMSRDIRQRAPRGDVPRSRGKLRGYELRKEPGPAARGPSESRSDVILRLRTAE
jgi:hypothetical protein